MSLAQASPEVAAPEVGAADRPRRRPNRPSVLDSLFLLALGSAALTGFALTFTGWGFLVVGVLGLLIGVLLGLLTTGLRWPAVAPILLAMAAFYLVGGPLTLRSVDALFPVPHTWRLLTDQVLFADGQADLPGSHGKTGEGIHEQQDIETLVAEVFGHCGGVSSALQSHQR